MIPNTTMLYDFKNAFNNFAATFQVSLSLLWAIIVVHYAWINRCIILYKVYHDPWATMLDLHYVHIRRLVSV